MLRWKSSLKPAAAVVSTDITLEDSAVTTAASFSTPTNIDVNIPAVSTDDILLLLVTTNDGSSPTDSPPSDWTKIVEKDGTNTSSHSTVAAYWKRASSSAVATTETWSSFFPSGESYYIWVGAYSGCITGESPIDAYGTAAVGFSSSWSVNVTTTVNNTMVVTICGTTQSAVTQTWTDGTELIDTAYPGSDAAVSINEKLEATSGAKTRASTPSTATSSSMIAVALKPAVDGYLIDENFDDNLLPSGWTFTSDATNTYTVSGGLLYAVNGSDYVTFDVPSAMQDEFWMYARLESIGGNFSKAAYQDMFEILDSSNAEFIQGQFYGNSTGFYRLDGATTATSQMASINGTVGLHVWFHFVKNGTSELWISQSSSRPTTDSSTECVISCSTANTSAAKFKLKLGWANGVRPLKWDFFIGDQNEPAADPPDFTEDFEGTGTPTSWSTTIVGSGTVDYDHTTSPGTGSESLEVITSGGDSYSEVDLGSVYGKFELIFQNKIASGSSNRWWIAGSELSSFSSNETFNVGFVDGWNYGWLHNANKLTRSTTGVSLGSWHWVKLYVDYANTTVTLTVSASSDFSSPDVASSTSIGFNAAFSGVRYLRFGGISRDMSVWVDEFSAYDL